MPRPLPPRAMELRDLLPAKGIPPELAKYAANHSAPGAASTLDELELDTLLTDIADGADERLAYQMQFPATLRPAAQK